MSEATASALLGARPVRFVPFASMTRAEMVEHLTAVHLLEGDLFLGTPTGGLIREHALDHHEWDGTPEQVYEHRHDKAARPGREVRPGVGRGL
ncbi:hypothetical protein EDD28_0047 [Salana multivorans]|uniref:Uncharacterized protein n=1 Tax=Salana multivorans TaxID=120377 RepID=A0A3N2D7S2_9MICO|nr:hypothetical protein EDD28_0047 [Salana multivorans]